MTMQRRRYARVARRRSGEQGLTLIELLLSLAILAVLMAFLAGGLSMGRRAFDADRVSGIGNETDAAIQAISTLIASALPARANTGNQQAAVMFDGRQGSMLFIGLSEGRSLRGGPHKIGLRQLGGDLVIDLAAAAEGVKKGAAAEPSIPGVVVLRGVREIHFGYFGRTNPSGAAGWRNDWFGLDHLPDLVSVRIDFEDERRSGPATIVSLRQG
jgi:prepilin-type N-terminal cleavage/methylation domain-containing protein